MRRGLRLMRNQIRRAQRNSVLAAGPAKLFDLSLPRVFTEYKLEIAGRIGHVNPKNAAKFRVGLVRRNTHHFDPTTANFKIDRNRLMVEIFETGSGHSSRLPADTAASHSDPRHAKNCVAPVICTAQGKNDNPPVIWGRTVL